MLTVHTESKQQARTPFKGSERFPLDIGNIIVSDLCSPFETLIGGYTYFIAWIDMKSHYASIEFIKNKKCATVTNSFRHYITWILKQKNADVKHKWARTLLTHQQT